MLSTIIEVLGWYGTVVIVGAYALTSFGMVSPKSILYQALNFTGSIGIIIAVLPKQAYQPAVLNTVWAIIAALAIGRIIRGRLVKKSRT